MLGLQHCHSAGIAHRDLKLCNVLITNVAGGGLARREPRAADDLVASSQPAAGAAGVVAPSRLEALWHLGQGDGFLLADWLWHADAVPLAAVGPRDTGLPRAVRHAQWTWPQRGRVVLCDFGCAAAAAGHPPLRDPNEFLPRYYGQSMLPPEAYVQPGEAFAPYDVVIADAFSAGSVLYNLLTISHGGDARARWLSTLPSDDRWRSFKQSNDAFWSLAAPHVSASARSLVNGLMAADPAQRLSLAAALQHPWMQASLPTSLELHAFMDRMHARLATAPRLGSGLAVQ